MNDKSQLIITNMFNKSDEQLSPLEMKVTIKNICDALRRNGFDPARRIAGYIISEDPAYIPDCENARIEIAKLDRDYLLSEIVKEYIDGISNEELNKDCKSVEND